MIISFLILSIIINIFLFRKVRRLQKTVDHHADALTSHVKDEDDLTDTANNL